MSHREIVVRGARENNLDDVTVAIPRGSLTTITGVSGSGKSSLAFDTIHNEGQRRFLESLSSYARQFLGRIEKPDVDHVDGLSPTVSIDQKTVNRNPRSTVGTITEIYDHLRLLFARLGTPHCPKCGGAIRPQTLDQITDGIMARHPGADVLVLAPIVRDRKGSYRKELADYRLKGFVRARIDGEIKRLDEEIELARYVRHTIEIVVDRLRVKDEKKSRLSEAIEQALKLADGLCGVSVGDEHELHSTRNSCLDCGGNFPELEPRLFSFNSPHGACDACDGLGVLRDVDPDLIIEPTLSINGGAIVPLGKSKLRDFGGISRQTLPSIAAVYGMDLDLPWEEMPAEHREIILEGTDGEKLDVDVDYKGKNWRVRSKKKIAPTGLLLGMRVAWDEKGAPWMTRFLADGVCRTCQGGRLKPAANAVTFRERTIRELTEGSVDELRVFLEGVEPTEPERPIAEPIFKELRARLEFLAAVGLGYLTVDRSAATLSGGESQRIRLATQVGSRLKGILYVLDEPSIGLHHRDNARLISTLEDLRDLGNTVCVVEHDQEMMERSDHVIDVGPGAGVHGGQIVAEGTIAAIKKSASLTADYLSGRRSIPMPVSRREADDRFLTVVGARQHNLKSVDAKFPVGCFTVVAGVSGSGKSTLVDDILKRHLAARFHNATARPGDHDRIDGVDHFDKVIEIDQSPIGRTPRSNPATYTKVFDLIRDLFAQVPEAMARGYKKGRFSFNVSGGRCDECQGAGVKIVAMQFLPDVEVICDHCEGKRFNPETLEITYRDKTICDVLEMTIEEAAEFFAKHPKIKRIFDALLDVGLSYIRLGQTATTLSGGEAQRVKLASELRRPATGRTLYLLDEPTTGLHFEDIQKLLAALQRLVDTGNTVIVIEHNLDVVKVADWIVELGPDGGAGGGRIVYEGPFEGVLTAKGSETGKALDEHLNPKPRRRSRKRTVKDTSAVGEIVVEGARTHNLKSVDVRFPSGKLCVVTGPSGSGKTSLAFDTVFAEGQRRFVESLSSYARQFLGRLEKAPVDRIEGLAPAIAINQKNASRNPRSTVATTTEIYDYLRLLFARIGRPHCPDCSAPLVASAPDQVWKTILRKHRDARGRIVAPLFSKSLGVPLALEKPGEFKKFAKTLKEAGYARVLIDGKEVRLDRGAIPATGRAKEIGLVVDRITVSPKSRQRVLEAVEQGYVQGRGVVGFFPVGDADADVDVEWFTERRHCPLHDRLVDDDISPRLFSFNSHAGACPDCSGVGLTRACDTDRLVNRPEKPLLNGAMHNKAGKFFLRRGYFRKAMKGLGEAMGFDLAEPFESLPKKARDALLHGHDERVPFKVRSRRKGGSSSFEAQVRWPGLCGYVEKWFHETESDGFREKLAGVMREATCRTCDGHRLRPEALAITIGGKNVAQLTGQTVEDAARFFEKLKLGKNDTMIAERPLEEVRNRLDFLCRVGLEYLSLERSAATLSGGEAQRIRLATQIGSGLCGVVYVLDEPTIGLHQRDTQRLLVTLDRLKTLGNTVIVVEHDEETMAEADWIVDLGPGAGHRGGEVVFQGPRSRLLREKNSVTADFLTGKRTTYLPPERRDTSGDCLVLRDAETNNLKKIDASFPLGCLVAVSGVSGSGKSSLVVETLVPALRRSLQRQSAGEATYRRLEGVKNISEMIVIDQAPIGRTPKSNPATYTKVFDPIREVFSRAPQAQLKGFKPARFSFNVPGGRCEACVGRGAVEVEMNFLADVWITCDVCGGKRYNRETLAVEYRGKTIGDVLDMEIEDAVEFFKNHRRIVGILQTLHDVGLGYLKLGQASNTLSGGEAQRIKLARELARRPHGRVLYVLDEPTTGLHFDDVDKLVRVLHRLVDQGHTVVVIEHNLDLIASADHVVDLGPEGGDGGGEIIAEGTPEDIAKVVKSATGQFLAARRGGKPKSAKKVASKKSVKKTSKATSKKSTNSTAKSAKTATKKTTEKVTRKSSRNTGKKSARQADEKERESKDGIPA